MDDDEVIEEVKHYMVNDSKLLFEWNPEFEQYTSLKSIEYVHQLNKKLESNSESLSSNDDLEISVNDVQEEKGTNSEK